MRTSAVGCDHPCRDPNCRDAADYGVGFHCHHDHRDPETKRVQDEYEARSTRREKAIQWLTDNFDKLEQLIK